MYPSLSFVSIMPIPNPNYNPNFNQGSNPNFNPNGHKPHHKNARKQVDVTSGATSPNHRRKRKPTPKTMATLRRGLRSLSTVARKPNGQELAEGELKRLRSLGLVFERFQETGNLVRQVDQGLPFSPRWLRLKRRQLVYRTRDVNGSLQISRYDTQFATQPFLEQSFEVFRKFNAGLIYGKQEFMNEAAVEHLQKLIRESGVPAVFNLRSSVDAVFAARIEELVEPAEVVQKRTLRVSTQQNFRFAQLTVRFLTRQVPMFEEDVVKYVRAKKSAMMKPRPVVARPDEWKLCFAEDGKEYFWHTGTGKVQWKRPMTYGVSRVHFNPFVGTLGSGRVVERSEKDAIVENFVVFERPLFNLKVPWRVCDF